MPSRGGESPAERKSHMKTKRMSKAFYDYKAVIESLDIEATTSFEIDALLEEMAVCLELENWEYCVLYSMIMDMMKGGRE